MRLETERWLAMADEDWQVAALALSAGYRNAFVFHAHLSVEKVLKALIIEATGNDVPPFSHNLLFLASRAGLFLPDNVKALLRRLTPLGTDARYALSGQYEDENCAVLVANVDEALVWLRQQLN